MSRPRVQPLPYVRDAGAWFERLRSLPQPVWLDSGGSGIDILAAAPVEFRRFAPGEAGAVAATLRDWMGAGTAPPSGLPFAGGIIGYLGYELGRAWQGLPPAHQHSLPPAAFGRYDWALVVDHRQCAAWLVGQGEATRTEDAWEALCRRFASPAAPADPAPGGAGEILGDSLPWPAYRDAFARIHHYLREGDIYQVNLTRCLEARSSEPAWSLYRRLRALSPAPWGAFLDHGDFQLLSNSPEQFLSLHGRRVETRPIKGTRPRADDAEQDRRLRTALAASEKDRAENLMIVDLLRNDLGRVCAPGSIAVPELFAVESFATVHHLVSTVTGELAEGRDAVDLLQACFPGGSITGAPKRRAMQVIDELEPVSREAYCGSLFRLGYDGALESSIAIRTLVREGERLRYWAGGGIVADSSAEAEFREADDKAAAFRRLLGA